MIPYIIDSFRGGISDEHGRGLRGAYKFGYGLDIHKRRDSLSCLYAMQTISSCVTTADPPGVTDLIKSVIVATDGSTYAFGDSGHVYSIAGSSSDPDIRLKYEDANGAIKGAAEWKLDTLVGYLFWATGTSLARKAFPGDDAWGDVTVDHKTTLESADWHTMAPASGSLMICNGNYIASYGYDGAFDPADLNLRPGNIAKCLAERDDYVLIGSGRKDQSEEGHIWGWISSDTSWSLKKKIPVKGINALLDTEVTLLQGSDNGEIFFSDFANLTPLNSIPDGGQCNPYGVSPYEDLAMFGIYGTTSNLTNGIYSYGRKMRNRPFALNYDYRLAATAAGSTVTEIGAVWTTNGTHFASWKTVDGSTTTYGVDMVSSTTRATARYEALEFTGQQPHIKKNFLNVKFVLEPLPASTSVNCIFKTNRETDWRYALVASGGGTTFSTTDATEAEFTLGVLGRVYEVGAILTPSGTSTPEISAIVTYLDEGGLEH